MKRSEGGKDLQIFLLGRLTRTFHELGREIEDPGGPGPWAVKVHLVAAAGLFYEANMKSIHPEGGQSRFSGGTRQGGGVGGVKGDPRGGKAPRVGSRGCSDVL